MKLPIFAVLAGAALATPALAQTRTARPVDAARPEVARPTQVDRARGPVDAGPVVTRRDDRPNEPNWGQINRQIIARAHNAIEGGADPAAVRRAVHAYRQHLRRRWNAANGGN